MIYIYGGILVVAHAVVVQGVFWPRFWVIDEIFWVCMSLDIMVVEACYVVQM